MEPVRKSVGGGKLEGVAKKIDTKKGNVAMSPKVKGVGVVGASKMRDCRHCGRPFIMDRVEIHELICQRSKAKKKSMKPFIDPATKADKGTSSDKNKDQPLPSAPNWREQHNALISSIRGAKDAYRKTGDGNLSKLPPPAPPTSGDNIIQCPHCGRRFNREAGERHIPQCKNFNFNKPKKM